ncbi:hypothetical protein D3C85_1432770 [compost metagenome]
MSYPVTPTLSVEAIHVKVAVRSVCEGEDKFPGTVGGCVSPIETEESCRLPKADVFVQLSFVPAHINWLSRPVPVSVSLFATSNPMLIPAVGVSPRVLHGIANSTLYPPGIGTHPCTTPAGITRCSHNVLSFQPLTYCWS